MMERRKFALIGVAASLIPAAALAQPAGSVTGGSPASPADAPAVVAPSAPEQPAPQGGLEEIVVTAQKRAENLQNVPIAVSAVTGAALENQHITGVEQLTNSIPNVQINHFSNSSDSAVFTIRGVGVNDADPYVGTTVSVVVDGVVVGVNTAALLSLFDIERVEILRGPQGTLFGANTTGGVVNVVTKQPTGQFGFEGQALYGNYNRFDLNGALNFPITDSLSGKISVLHTESHGFFRDFLTDRHLGGRNVTAIRPYLKYTSGDYTATLIGEYDRSRNGSQTGVNFSDASQLLYDPAYSAPDKIRYRRGQSPNVPDKNNRNTYSVTLTQNIASSVGNITSITNYRKYKSDLYSDDDGLPAILLQTRRQSGQHQFSEELRDDIKVSDRFQLIAGVFYFDQQYHLDQTTQLDGFLKGLGQPQTQFQKNWSISGFAQGYYNLTDALRLQAGIRYSHEKTDATSTTANSFTTTPGGYSSIMTQDPIIPGTFLSVSGKKAWNNVGYKVGLDYKASPGTLLYGYYARGFKSGGFTGRIVRPEDIGPFSPEHLDTFEIGAKNDFLDHHLRLNIAAFYNIYKDMQVTQNITYTDGKNSASIVNAGRAHTKGFEIEATALPAEGLTLTGSLAYLDARYTRYDTQILDPATNTLVPISYKGNRLMNAPRWNATASASYKLALGPGSATIFVQDTYTSSKYTNFDDLPQERIGSINLVNGNLSWSPDNERYSIGVYGRNMFNKKYYGQKLYLPGTFAVASLGDPREYGVDLKVHF